MEGSCENLIQHNVKDRMVVDDSVSDHGHDSLTLESNKIMEDEMKYIVLEFLNSTLPTAEPIEIDSWENVNGSIDYDDTESNEIVGSFEKKGSHKETFERKSKDFHRINHSFSPDEVFNQKEEQIGRKKREASLPTEEIPYGEERDLNNEYLEQKHRSKYISFQEFTERREKIRQWHLRKQMKKKGATFVKEARGDSSRGKLDGKSKFLNDQDYISDKSYVPVKEKVQILRNRSKRNSKEVPLQMPDGISSSEFEKGDSLDLPVNNVLQPGNAFNDSPSKEGGLYQKDSEARISNEELKRSPNGKFKASKKKMEKWMNKPSKYKKDVLPLPEELDSQFNKESDESESLKAIIPIEDISSEDHQIDANPMSLNSSEKKEPEDNMLLERESSYMSYERFIATREKLKEMLKPVRKSIDKGMKKGVISNDEQERKNRRQRTSLEREESYANFLAAREQLKQIFMRKNKQHYIPRRKVLEEEEKTSSKENFLEKREKLKNIFESRKRKQRGFASGRKKVDEDAALISKEEFQEKREKIKRLSARYEQKCKSEKFDGRKLSDEVFEVEIGSSKNDNYLVSQEESLTSEVEKGKKIPSMSVLIPNHLFFDEDLQLTPESYAVHCLEAISEDIMSNDPNILFGAVHDLLTPLNKESTISYDKFSRFAKTLHSTKTVLQENVWSHIAVVLSVVKEALIYGGLNDAQVEMMVEHSTKFVMENGMESFQENRMWFAMESLGYNAIPDEEDHFFHKDDNSGSSEDVSEINANGNVESVLEGRYWAYDWLPFGIAMLTVSLGLAYSYFKGHQ